MYFLGHAGVVQVNGIRIAGASGIFKGHDFHLGALRRARRIRESLTRARVGHHERMPYDRGTMRSIYHIREYNVRRLSLVRPSPRPLSCVNVR
jgi:lariat debranching enzyme